MKKIVLDNGLGIVMVRRPFLKTVAISMVVKAGSANETQKSNGAAHFVEHMVFRWIREKAQSNKMYDLESLGGTFGAITQQTYTKYNINILQQFIDNGLNTFCDILERITFNEGDIEKEKSVIVQEIFQQRYDQPFVVREEIFLKNLFKEHPLGLSILGTEQSVKSITKNDLYSFYRKYYVPNNIVISVVGNVDYTQVEERIKKLFGKLEPAEINFELPKIQPRNEKIIKELSKKGLKQVHIVIGGYAPKFDDKRKYAMKLLTTILGCKTGSRFYSKFIYDLGIAYNVGSQMNEFVGFHMNYLSTSTKNLSLAKNTLFKELSILLEKGVTLEELQSAKNYIKGFKAICQELNYVLADECAINESFAEAEDVNKYDHLIDSVDITEINEVAREFIDLKTYVMILLKPND